MQITRRSALTTIVAGCAAVASTPLMAASPKRHYDLTPKKVADGLWIIEGSTEYFTDENGGAIVNCALLESDAGLIVVDTGVSLKYGEALRQVTSNIGALGVAAVFNTHHHPDHFFGNQAFAERPIYALAETKKLAEQEGDGFSDNMYRLLGNWMRGTEVVPPTEVLASSAITIGGRDLTVLPLQGHTDGDLALLDKKTGTLITGDLAFYNRAPTTPHADIDKWTASLQTLQSVGASAVLPGHGPIDRTGESLKQTAAYLGWLKTALQAAAAQGLDMVEIMHDTNVPAEFAAMGAMPQEFHRSVAHLYSDIERQAMPLTNQN